MSLWGSILSKVAQVGISLLSQYAEPSANSDSLSIPNTQIGNITYTLDPETNKIYATNFDLGSTETSISYSKSSDDGQLTTVIQTLPPGKSYEASSDIKDFATGELALVPSSVTQLTESVEVSMRQVLTAIAVLFAAKIFLTSKIIFEKTENGFKIDSEFAISNVQLSYQDKDGRSFNISAGVKSNSNSNTITIPFPDGSSKEFPFHNVSITISMPTPSFDKITEERRKLLVDISEVPHLKKVFGIIYGRQSQAIYENK